MRDNKLKKLDHVVKSNKVIEASYRLSLLEQRTILTAISQIKHGTKVTDEIMYYVKSSDLVELGSNLKNSYRDLKSASSQLFERRIMIYHNEKGNTQKLLTRWIQSINYLDEEGTIGLRFSKDILPYLTQLKGNFTRYSISDISGINTLYAIRIYELLMQWSHTSEREITIESLRNFLDVENKYDLMSNFRRKVIETSIKDINDNTPLFVSWKPIKDGRKIISILFSYHLKKDHKKKINGLHKIQLSKSYIEGQAKPGETWQQAKERIMTKSNSLQSHK